MPHTDPTTGALVLAATPIGDSRDASPRLLEELTTADIIAAEDTRRLRKLADRLGVDVKGEVVSYYEHNEAARTPELVTRMAEGARVLLVTDAGMPSVSDPGYRLVSACVEAEVHVTCVPGPSAVLMALAVSGLPVDRFCFEGFLPRKQGERARMLATLSDEPRTMVFFEAPHRLAATLSSMAEAFGDERPAAVCRELTKTYEETRRGGLAELAAWAADGVKGEITVVVSGRPSEATRETDPASLIPEILERAAAGERLKDVTRDVAARTGQSAKVLYDAAIAAR